ncbi:MAG: OOP family OmpA-OmpF porin [Cellvibrionaceae bacterium]|jgi:OOP family OmpA-OmpF porin
MKQLAFLVMVALSSSSFLISANSVSPSEVQSQNLPVDSDVDGVIDQIDECYKTAVGVQVDSRGCPLVVKYLKQINLNINFDYDSAIVKSAYFSEVEKIAFFMRENSTARLIIEGHTDSDGAVSYNKSLSSRRAQSVARVLVTKFSIKTLRVTALGFGEDRPLVSNDTQANKAKNRRVVAVIRTLKENRG